MLQTNREIKKLTLYDIKKELTHPFADIRLKYTEPSRTDVFNWLSGETDNSLCVGMVVAARAFRHTERSVLCKLENGLMGFINYDNISDEREAAVNSTIPIGTTVHARILEINRDRFSLKLSCRGQDLDNDRFEYDKCEDLQKINKYLMLNELVAEREKEKEQAKNGMNPRLPILMQGITFVIEKPAVRNTWNVHHPLFKITDYKGAEQYLSDKPVGEVVIRPSSKATDHLTYSWKFAEGVYIHTGTYLLYIL